MSPPFYKTSVARRIPATSHTMLKSTQLCPCYSIMTCLALTCGEHHIPGDKVVVYNGELGQLNPFHSRHSTISPTPVEVNVICGVAICRRVQKHSVCEMQLSQEKMLAA